MTYNGHQRPILVNVDARFLFSSSSSNNYSGDRDSLASGVLSIEKLNHAITDALRDGYKWSGNVMGDKLRGMYEQLGLSSDPILMPSFAQDENNKYQYLKKNTSSCTILHCTGTPFNQR